jgi:uncharacterized protein (PEP-CTERM system associated)
MWLDLGAALAQSRRAVCLVALAPMLAAAPAAAQVTSGVPAPTVQTPARNSQGSGSGVAEKVDPTEIRGLDIRTGIALDEIFTDNARGVASGGLLTVQSNNAITTTPQAKTSDLVSRVTPMLSIVDRTTRLQAGLVFQPSYQKYAFAHDLDRFENSLLGTASAELWREHFFLDSSISMSSEIINSQAAVTTNARTLSTNRADLNSYLLTPTYRQAFGTFALGEVKYRLGQTSSGAIAPSTSNGIEATLRSSSDADRLAWIVTLETSRTSQGATPDAGQIVDNVAVPTATNATSRHTGTFDSTYALNHIVSLLGGFGYEEIRNGSLAQNPKGPIGNFGIGITGARSELKVKMNYRYGGEFVSVDGKYELGPQLRLTGSYNQSVTTSQEQTLDDLAALRLAANGGLVAGSSGQPFVPINSALGINSGIGNTAYHDSMTRLGVNGTFGRNTYTMDILDETRTTQTTNFDETTMTVSGGWVRELTPLTRFNLSLGYTNTADRGAVQRTDDTYNASTGFNFQLNDSLTATATYSVVYRRSNQPGQDVRENSILFGIRKSI